MDISTVIPIYNRQREGERALRSALAQGEVVREVVLVDDASSAPFVVPQDLTGDPRIRLIRHDRNRGESGARNTGIAQARHPWIAFLDSDDYWLPGKLSAQVAYAMEDQARAHDTLRLYATGFLRINTRTGRRQILLPRPSARLEDFASGCWFMQGSTVLLHKAAAAAAGPCDERLRRIQDLDWYLRIALAGGSLKVAPVIGAVIEIGPRPTPDALEPALRIMHDKWIAPGAMAKLSAECRRRLQAYLDVERASAMWAAGRPLGTAGFLARSLLTFPRARVHLNQWWSDGRHLAPALEVTTMEPSRWDPLSS